MSVFAWFLLIKIVLCGNCSKLKRLWSVNAKRDTKRMRKRCLGCVSSKLSWKSTWRNYGGGNQTLHEPFAHLLPFARYGDFKEHGYISVPGLRTHDFQISLCEEGRGWVMTMGYCLIPVVFIKQMEDYRWLVNPIRSLPILTSHGFCFPQDGAKIDAQVLREDASHTPAISLNEGAVMTEEKTKKADKKSYCASHLWWRQVPRSLAAKAMKTHDQPWMINSIFQDLQKAPRLPHNLNFSSPPPVIR